MEKLLGGVPGILCLLTTKPCSVLASLCFPTGSLHALVSPRLLTLMVPFRNAKIFILPQACSLPHWYLGSLPTLCLAYSFLLHFSSAVTFPSPLASSSMCSLKSAYGGITSALYSTWKLCICSCLFSLLTSCFLPSLFLISSSFVSLCPHCQCIIKGSVREIQLSQPGSNDVMWQRAATLKCLETISLAWTLRMLQALTAPDSRCGKQASHRLRKEAVYIFT